MSVEYVRGDDGYEVRRQAGVALVTARALPAEDVDLDMPLLAERLRRDLAVRVLSWDDPDVDWSDFDLVVVRSTWDYHGRLEEFLFWVDRCSRLTRLANPAGLIRWNSDKTYLRELADRGVAVVPTGYLPPGALVEVPEDREFVIKPAVGAGAHRAARYTPDELPAALEHIRQLHDDDITVMVQPYQSAVDTTGERALIFVCGEYSHAIRKGAVLASGAGHDAPRDAHPDVRVWTPTPAEMALAHTVLAATAGIGLAESDQPLYARVDLVDGRAGARC